MKILKILLYLALSHIVAVLPKLFFSSNDRYADEHIYYYFVLLIFSGFIFTHRKFGPKWKSREFITLIKRNWFSIIILTIVGLIFQTFPDSDIKLGIGHRSIFTHSILPIYLLFLLINKNKQWYLNNVKIINLSYMGAMIGLTSHLLVDISYMFLLSPTPVLVAHKGHGWIVPMISGLEIPFILSMTVFCGLYLNRLLKMNFSKMINVSIIEYKNIFSLTKVEATLLLLLSISMVLNTGRDIPSTILFEVWALLSLIFSLIILTKSK